MYVVNHNQLAPRPKPKHLEVAYAEQFKDWSVVDAYRYRPSYPPGLFTFLATLMRGASGAILDVGCGTGDIARFLTSLATRVDAVDFSEPMITTGRTLPGGGHPKLRWIEGTVEEAELSPPYALITAGESIHWMDWERVFPRFRAMLPDGGHLALINRAAEPNPWDADVLQVIQQFSTNRDYRPYNILDELVSRDVFIPQGSHRTVSLLSPWNIQDFVESYHSRNGLSRDRMSRRDAAAFDRAVTAIVAPCAADGQLTLHTYAVVTWGTPGTPESTRPQPGGF